PEISSFRRYGFSGGGHQTLGGHSNRKMTERYIRLRRSLIASGPNHRAGTSSNIDTTKKP
ncbi:hypothetical protein, partial [Amnimonas aquatica]|uniref:hypothetical protein n=1 Tax=Amnimonas aquatica TaxID=2094561 RepID=UPI0019D1C872